jgi:hypothetical protein
VPEAGFEGVMGAKDSMGAMGVEGICFTRRFYAGAVERRVERTNHSSL